MLTQAENVRDDIFLLAMLDVCKYFFLPDACISLYLRQKSIFLTPKLFIEKKCLINDF